MPGDYTQAEIVRTLHRIEEGQKELAQKVEAQAGFFVSRDAWTMKNLALDREIVRIHNRVDDIKDDLESSRAPWWTWATVLTALAMAAVNIIPKLAA